MSRQNYYARRRERQRRQVEGELVVALVKRERQLQPRLGTRKLHRKLKAEWAQAGVKVGRERLFEELRGRDLDPQAGAGVWFGPGVAHQGAGPAGGGSGRVALQHPAVAHGIGLSGLR